MTVTGKGTCFLAGSIQDFEVLYRASREPTDFNRIVHDRLNDTWGYSDDAHCADPNDVICRLVEVVTRNGVYALNIAPNGNGSIPRSSGKLSAKAVSGWS